MVEFAESITNSVKLKLKLRLSLAKDEKSKINKDELRKHLIMVGNEYKQKLELGKAIYEIKTNDAY